MLNVNEVIVKKFEVHADAEMFIIPNHASVLKPDSWNMAKAERIRELALKNDVEYVPFTTEKNVGTKLVQLWYVSEDLHTENLVDHGGKIKLEDGSCVILRDLSRIIHSLPETFLEDIHEGETVELKIPTQKCVVFSRNDDDDVEVLVDLTLNLTAAQTKYRYSNFGSFERTLEYVTT